MLINQVVKENKKIVSVIDKITKEVYDAWIKEVGEHQSHRKYKIHLKTADERLDSVGYITFVSNIYGNNSYTLSGMQSELGYRGRNISDILLETLFQYASINDSEFSDTVHQRKPLTTYILQKYGFEAIDNRPRDVVEILGRYQEEKLLIAFKDKNKEKEFNNSNICIYSQQYKIVDSNPTLIKDTVTLLSQYMLMDNSKCDERRRMNNKRFIFNFES